MQCNQVGTHFQKWGWTWIFHVWKEVLPALHVAVKSWGSLPPLSQEQDFHGCRAGPSTAQTAGTAGQTSAAGKALGAVHEQTLHCFGFAHPLSPSMGGSVLAWSRGWQAGGDSVLHPSYGIPWEILEFPELMQWWAACRVCFFSPQSFKLSWEWREM